MVLESLISPEKAENRPFLLALLGALYTSLAMFLSYMIFKEYSSLFMVFLATIASIPLIYRIIKLEEEKDLTDVSEVFLLKEHWKALSAFMYLFLGATLAFVFWYVILPSNTISIIYESQTSTIISINGRASEIYDTTITGDATNQMSSSTISAFSRIFFNNVKVLLFCVLFSFLYGAGAIFILLWNASVIGTAIGNYIRSNISLLLAQGNAGIASYFSVVSIGLTKYIIHGFPEILAYFFAALAGGIISIAIINHEVASRKFEHILLDAADLLMLSLITIFIAAVLEVWVTPFIFS
ncbi:MAG: hypothetical protein KatS3mg002_0597 [Candidatus Woesearchaeota archaeon]|nr:MAG: hypothetical protein KatS3mg002_0597 [Candidatus Woesearchaeota archaeon]